MLLAVPLNDACEIEEDALVYSTAGITTLDAQAELQTGTDYSAQNFGGVSCGQELIGDTVERWLNITGTFCLIDWAFMSAASGNPTVVDGDGNVVGYQRMAGTITGACESTTRPRIHFAIARRVATGAGGCVTSVEDTGATSIAMTFFPMSTDWRFEESPFANERAQRPFTARAYANPAANAGVNNLWPADYTPDAIADDALSATAFIDPAGLPTVDCDAPQAHPAPDDTRTNAGS
jgi:hypothetical protein